MVQQVNTPIRFKAESYPISYNNRYTPPMPEDNLMDDVFLMQAMEQQKAKKKEQSKERWNKAGVLAQIGIAAAFLGMLAISLFNIAKGNANGASKNSELVWENLSKKKNFPKLDDDCVNPRVREFIQGLKRKEGATEKAMKYAGETQPEQCILMYGPSGTGKTFSGQLLANEIGAEYTKVQFADVSSPFIGQTSVEIQNVFKNINKIGRKNPDKKYVISFDEIDALLVPREKCGANNLHLAENRTAFLNGLDLIKDLKNVKIIGTTNVHPESGNLDKASLSRFGNMVEIGLPTEKELKAALKFHLKDYAPVEKHKFFENNDSAIDKLVKELHEKKYSQRDVELMIKDAKNRFFDTIKTSNNPETEKFDTKFLEKAMEAKGITTGQIEYTEAIPGWLKHLQQESGQKEKINLKQRLTNWWNSVTGK